MPLGVGGSANVYLARETTENGQPRLIALKILLSHLTRRRDSLAMFFSEAKIASRIEHDNVVSIYGLGKSDNVYCLAQEYVFGENFSDILLESGRLSKPLTVGAILRVIAQVASGLDTAHNLKDEEGKSLSLVHRDVTGHNIMLSFDGETKLMDFGIAKAADRGFETQTGIVKGKFPYMSPEQTLGKKLDCRSDIFSLGIIAWEALTGEPLFTGHSPGRIMKAIREKPILRPSEVSNQLSPVLDSLVMRALQRNPSKRYQTAKHFESAINEIISHAGLEIGPESIQKELNAIYSDIVPARRTALERAKQGENIHEELAVLFGVSSIYDCHIPQISDSIDRFNMVNLGQAPQTKRRSRPRTSSVHAMSNPEFVRIPVENENFNQGFGFEAEEKTLSEAQDVLISLEEEIISQPMVDIHDLMDGWDSTANEPINVPFVDGGVQSEIPNSSTEIVRESDNSSRIRTKRERPEKPLVSTGRILSDESHAPLRSASQKSSSASVQKGTDSPETKTEQYDEEAKEANGTFSANNIMISILMFLVGILLVYWLKQLR